MSSESPSSPERQRVIERLRTGSLLDAAYIVSDFNRRCRFTKEKPIALEEIAEGLPPAELEMAKRKADALHADEAYFGEKHWTHQPREQIYEEMRKRHPDFGRNSYELALHRGIFAMR